MIHDVGHGTEFDQPSAPQHGNAVRDAPDDGQIVADEQQAQPAFPLNVEQQLQDRRLDRDIQRGSRFIRNDHLGLWGQGAGDGNALTLPAREFMRQAVEHLVRQANPVKQPADLLPQRRAGQATMDGQRFVNGLAGGETRVEAGEGVLKDHLDTAPGPAQRCTAQAGNVLAIDQHLPFVIQVQSGGYPAQRRLARSAFSNQRQCLARRKRQGDVV